MELVFNGCSVSLFVRWEEMYVNYMMELRKTVGSINGTAKTWEIILELNWNELYLFISCKFLVGTFIHQCTYKDLQCFIFKASDHSHSITLTQITHLWSDLSLMLITCLVYNMPGTGLMKQLRMLLVLIR